ncbi:MAG TPA: hypothetical protein PKH02_07245 [Bacteroidales bacterium]|nr:hypothetical protein [Bacteroidales bacterium]
MKKIVFSIVVIGLFIFSSCGKDEGSNHFTYKNTTYPIDSIVLHELVFNDGTATESSIFQFIFFSIDNGDTTRFPLALYDEDTQVLGGNYPSVISNSDETRRIISFGIICLSGLQFQDDTYVYTGEGGSVDISNNKGTYTIKFNKISAGVYTDLFDTNHDNNVGYTEVSTISGSFKGVIDKNIHILTKNINEETSLIKNFK